MEKLHVKLVAAKLREVHGNAAAASRHFGVNRTSMWRFIQKHPQLQEVLSECRETMKDMAESQLYNQVLAGDPGQVRFFLSSQAKDRGYVPRTETTQVGAVRVEIVEQLYDYDDPQDLPPAPGAAAIPPE
jgi:hypothetical protein